jgi:lactate dehydrogenase-like 2-hydroxyacid dehydrogenase
VRRQSYDVGGTHVGAVAGGRIGLGVLRRLKPSTCVFIIDLASSRRLRKSGGLAWHPGVEDMVKVCDVVTINAPLHKAPNSQAVRATYGSRSRLPRITPGGLCRIAA